MTEEELQAFKKLQEIKSDYHSEYWEFGRKTDKEMEKWADTLIQLIKKQQKEIEQFGGIRNGTTLIYKSNSSTYVKQEWFRENYIRKDELREHLEKLNISDIEPWTVYKISGIWLYNLERLLGDEK